MVFSAAVSPSLPSDDDRWAIYQDAEARFKMRLEREVGGLRARITTLEARERRVREWIDIALKIAPTNEYDKAYGNAAILVRGMLNEGATE